MPTKIVFFNFCLFFFSKKDIEEAFAGDICALFGIDCSTGDTFVTDKDLKLTMESMHVPDPVISMSIKPIDSNSSDNFSKGKNRYEHIRTNKTLNS